MKTKHPFIGCILLLGLLSVAFAIQKPSFGGK